jgi:hypothetical protein
MTGRNDMNLRLAGQAIGDAVTGQSFTPIRPKSACTARSPSAIFSGLSGQGYQMAPANPGGSSSWMPAALAEEQARQQRMTAQAQNISRNDVALYFWIEPINSGEDRHSPCKRRSDSTTKSLSID